jgi:hypothetical protein
MDIMDDFQHRLKEAFRYNDLPFGRVHKLFQEQSRYLEAVMVVRYEGFWVLADAFKAFFIETVELFNTECQSGISTCTEAYSFFLPRLFHDFQSPCGAEHLMKSGYPMHAYTILRNTADNLLLSSAALQNITDFGSIVGLESGKPYERHSSKKIRKETERKVRDIMTGSKSGLTPCTIDELAKWDAMFDDEVHGGRLSFFIGSEGWWQGAEGLPIFPRFKERFFAIFINRFWEIAWMMHRLIPLIQPRGIPLKDEWRGKWCLLNEIFRRFVYSLTEEAGKKIGAAMVEFVDAKFPFNEESEFPL